MQLKPIAAIAVLLLVVASLLVTGCTISTASTASTATHDAFCEKRLAVNKNEVPKLVEKLMEKKQRGIESIMQMLGGTPPKEDQEKE